MPKLLALDTATDACSVALSTDTGVVEDFRVIPRQHTQQLLPMIKDMMAAHHTTFADLDGIAVGRGPGSFAGIRIAMGTAQGLAFASGLPVVPVSTLKAMALRAHKMTGAAHLVTALDARMNEIYYGCYQADGNTLVEVQAERVAPPTDLELPKEEVVYTAGGTGWVYHTVMPVSEMARITVLDEQVYPRAADILELGLLEFNEGRSVAPEEAQPVYLRDEVAWKKKDQQ
ncbi:MAG: tRNA (adenosine(37)-N6)-threonylcarbamoyltransferase complex dimerization subunit type 1 TsaB [Pontibacterium sp.]